MPIGDDEERPKKKLVHEIGQDLALLSVAKQASRTTADQFFKR
jgi:uncharacterized small protein (DUF1192 family)